MEDFFKVNFPMNLDLISVIQKSEINVYCHMQFCVRTVYILKKEMSSHFHAQMNFMLWQIPI